MKYIENQLVNLFTLESHNQMEKLKIEYGIKLIISEIGRLFIVYTIAILIGCRSSPYPFNLLYTEASLLWISFPNK